MKTKFAERLQALMDQKGLSKSDLARLIWGTMVDERGYTVAKNRQVLGRYLTGSLEPRIGTKRALADAMNIPLSTLDPASDPTERPGSGIYLEEVDRKNARLEIRVVAPKEICREVVKILTPYTM